MAKAGVSEGKEVEWPSEAEADAYELCKTCRTMRPKDGVCAECVRQNKRKKRRKSKGAGKFNRTDAKARLGVLLARLHESGDGASADDIARAASLAAAAGIDP